MLLQGSSSLGGSSSQQSSFSCILLNPHFHYNFPKTAFASPPAGIAISRPSLFVVNGNTTVPRQVHSYQQYLNITTAPPQVPPYPRYPFVGLHMEPDGKLCGLPWKNVGQASVFHIVEDSGSLKQKCINAVAGNEEEPVGDDLMTLSRNNLDARDQFVTSENQIPDMPLGGNSGDDVLACSGKEPEIPEVLQNFDTVPVGDNLGGDVPGCSGKEPEIAEGNGLAEFLQDFDIDSFVFDESLLDFEF